MLPSTVLGRVASRAVQIFAALPGSSTTATPPLSCSTHDFPQLVSCTRSLILLTKKTGRSCEDVSLLRCMQKCANLALRTLRQLPASADVPPDVSVTLFGVLRTSVGFWDGEKSAELAQLLSERVDAVVLRTWRPRVLLAAVHAIAKACPYQAAPLLFVGDALAVLHHQEAQLSERDVATLLWCMAVLHVTETHAQLWASLCHRATLYFARMNAVSRLTLSQALLLQHACLCESQAELLRVVYETNCELERYNDDAGIVCGSSPLPQQRSRRAAHFYAKVNAFPARTEAPLQLTAQLLQYTTHTLSDEALVRLLVTLVASSNGATEELLLVLAHLTQRTSLSERLCVQVLCFAQQYTAAMGDSGLARNSGESMTMVSAKPSTSLSLSPSEQVSQLVRQARQHVTRLLVSAVSANHPRAPREVAEVLCVEHCHLQNCAAATQDGSNPVVSSCAPQEALSSAAVWDALMAVLSTAFDRGSTALHSLGGAELWSWQCIRVYVKAVKSASAKSILSSNASSPAKDGAERLDSLDVYNNVERCWPNVRERQVRCAELIEASAQSTATPLLSHVDARQRSDALDLLEACVREVGSGVNALSVTTTLRLLAAVDEAPAAVLEVIEVLRPSLLTHWETHTSHAAGALPDMIQYLSTALVREKSVGVFRRQSSSSGSTAAGLLAAHPRVSEAVLDVYVRLLVQEQQSVLPSMQVDLLVRCLQERQRHPAALENAFMMLMTRRLGQSAALLTATTLPMEAMCRLIELASGLPRAQADTTLTATRTLILTTLLDILVQRCIPACNAADDLVAAALLLRLHVVWEFQRVSKLAEALQRRGTELLTAHGGAAWTPTQKAYLVAALVCAQQEPSQELLRALHGGDSDSFPRMPAEHDEERERAKPL